MLLYIVHENIQIILNIFFKFQEYDDIYDDGDEEYEAESEII